MRWDILIVNCEHGDLLASLLQSEGYRAEHVKTVEEAWDELLITPVALVMTDCLVSSLDGCELISLMRSKEELSKTPVLMATALRQEAVLAKCAFDAFLRKPFTAAELIGKVGHILRPPGVAIQIS
jgi:DNA-binding response OmpR family regulator